MTLKIGWLSTGNGEGSAGLFRTVIDAIQRENLDAEIVFLFCNREKGEHTGSDSFMWFAKSCDVPVTSFSSKKFRSENSASPLIQIRESYDRRVLKLLSSFETPDITVGAGYMLIAPLLCSELLMINLHPALPDGPRGTWRQIVRQLIERDASETGVMVHVVTREVDAGTPLSFCRFATTDPNADHMQEEMGSRLLPFKDAPLFTHIRARGLLRERILLRETLALVCQGKLHVSRDFAHEPIDLTVIVENQIRR